ncbi:MAG TPA: AsmA-like C-terminal region-containing protein, partial [Desulfuromonadaceae bacterium]
LLSSYLSQPVKIFAVHTSGATLYLKGVQIANPPGFPAGNLARVDSLRIAPQWRQLLIGRRSVRLVELEGVRLDLLKNSAGTWNLPVLKKTAKQPTRAEIFIRQLCIKDGVVRFNGRKLAKASSLTLFDLASQGSRTARIEAAFQDAGQNGYVLTGQIRSGTEPSFELSLKSPSLSLAPLAKVLKLNQPGYLKGTGSLLIKAGLHNGLLRSQGRLDLNHLAVQGINLPAGRINFSGDYSLKQDLAHLQELNLDLSDLIRLQVRATVENLRREKSFTAEISLQEIDLKRLAMFLSEEQRHQLVIEGRLGKSRLQLSGNAAQGITGFSGKAQLQNGSLAKEGRLLISGLCSNIALSRQNSGLQIKGEVALCKPAGKAMLEAVQGPFELELSSRLKLLKAKIAPFSARILGQTVKGGLAFNSSTPRPLTADLQLPTAALADLNPLLEKHNLRLTSGSGLLALRATGQNFQDFEAALDLQLSALKGKQGQTALALKKGKTLAQIQRSKGRLSLSGRCELKNLAWADKKGQAKFSYRYSDKKLVIDKNDLEWDGANLSFDRLTTNIPTSEKRGGASYYPLSLELTGGVIRQGQAAARNVSARMDAFYASDGSGRWMEGSASLAVGQFDWQGKAVAAPGVSLLLSRSGATGIISGTLLGGPLAGDVAFNPFAASKGATFRLGIKGAGLATAGELLAARGKATVTEGRLDAALEGSYAHKQGLQGLFEADGKDLRINGSGKTLLSDGGFHMAGVIAGQTITLQNAVVTVGQAINLQLKGRLEQPFSQQPSGSLSFVLPQTPCNTIVDGFVNLLPRFLQEATLEGSLAGQGTVELQEGKKLLQGALVFNKVGLESPEQKIVMKNLAGKLPFSLDLSGKKIAPASDRLSYSRKNYPLLRQQLGRLPDKGQLVTIDQLGFGPLELDSIRLIIRAEKGITEITSLRATLFEGILLGSGQVSMQETLSYRADLLINGLSLKALCNRFPNIKGYITGKVDGVVSLSAQEKGLGALIGFSELWARKGDGEQMLVSREFLQRLAGKKLSGFFFRQDRPYDKAEISASLQQGYLTFDALDIQNTNFLGLRDLNVSIAPTQNRIAVDHLMAAIKQASASGKAITDTGSPQESAPETEFKWQD